MLVAEAAGPVHGFFAKGRGTGLAFLYLGFLRVQMCFHGRS